jgi:hypothetical protein
MIDGFVFRFAACQFGKKTAGSPLGSIVRAVARYFAWLPDPVHVASWVDDLSFIDLIFIMSTGGPATRPRARRLVFRVPFIAAAAPSLSLLMSAPSLSRQSSDRTDCY